MNRDLLSVVSAVVDRNKTAAVDHVTKTLKRMYGESVQNLQLDHVDESGYWFSYELEQNRTRQVRCVRPHEI